MTEFSEREMRLLCSKAVKIFMEKVNKMVSRQKLNNYMAQEIGSVPVYFAGSRAECLQGLESDSDIIYESPSIHTVSSIEQASHLRDITSAYDAIVLLDTTETHEGYTKVKLFDVNTSRIHYDVDVTSLCQDQSPYLSNVLVTKYWKPEVEKGIIFPAHGMKKDSVQQHGPCIAFKYGGIKQMFDIDAVFSLKCDWPIPAMDWIMRHHDSKWPKQDVVSRIVTKGCNLVPIGHVNSPQRELEWRISFNKAEQELVLTFNGTQYACVDFMKIFFHARIKPQFTDLFPSYFVKTEMLWMIEESPSDIWIPENLCQCMEELLRRIILCVEKKEIRNYFIPSNNMLDTKPSGELDKLLSVLQQFQNGRPNKWQEVITVRIDEARENDIYVHHVHINTLCLLRHYTLYILSTVNAEEFTDKVNHIRRKIQKAISQDISKEICSILQSEIETVFMQYKLMTLDEFSDEKKTLEDNLEHRYRDQTKVDFCSIRLQLATLHVYQGRTGEARTIVDDVIGNYDHNIVHYTFFNRDKVPKDEDYSDQYRNRSSTFEDTLQRFIAFDVVCLPIMAHILPQAVRYVLKKAGRALFVHPLFYAHMLLVYCCVATKDTTRASQAADDLVAFIHGNSDSPLHMVDSSLRQMTGSCLDLLGRTDEARVYKEGNF